MAVDLQGFRLLFNPPSVGMSGFRLLFKPPVAGVGSKIHRFKWVAGSSTGGTLTTPADARTIDIDQAPAGIAQTDIAFDPTRPGVIAIALGPHHCVAEVDLSTGTMTLIAGTYGSAGSSGDGGAATSALLDKPTCLDYDSSGNLYIGDAGNHNVRKIDTGGTITNVWGTGATGTTVNDHGVIESLRVSGTKLWVFSTESTNYLKVATLPGVTSRSQSSIGTTNPNYNLASDGTGKVFFMEIAGASDTEIRVYEDGVASVLHYTETQATFWPRGGFAYDSVNSRLIGVSDATNTDGEGQIFEITGSIGSGVKNVIKTGVTVPGGRSDIFPASEGNTISNATVLPTRTTGPSGRAYIDPSTNQLYFINRYHVWAWFQEPEDNPVAYISAPNVLRSDKAGFDDDATAALVANRYAGTAADASGSRTATNLSSFVSSADIVIVGSSFSNSDADDLELESGLQRYVGQCARNAFSVDFQDRGTAGDGTALGATAPRINVVNRNGTFLVERHDAGGGNIRSYAVLMSLLVEDQTMVYCAGIRDIDTKAAAFVLNNAELGAYSSVLQTTNAVLVAVVYSTAINTAGVGSFDPDTSNTTIMPLEDVSGTQPVPP